MPIPAVILELVTKVALALDTPPKLAPLPCDEALLRQVLVNLVENALKYSPDGGRVGVRVADERDRVRIEVRDQGLGIPPCRSSSASSRSSIASTRRWPVASAGPGSASISRARSSSRWTVPSRFTPPRASARRSLYYCLAARPPRSPD
jgi:hypothetical protein